jgi:hypothetical protein
MKYPSSIPNNERGMISITVTVVFIMVISLTVLGFSQVTRRNSREALDRQLSAQAFYAAEVGINDARNKIANLVENNQQIDNQTDCKKDWNTPGGYTKNSGQVDPANGVSYTCTLVKSNLSNIQESNVGGGSVILPLNASTGTLGAPVMKWKPSTSVVGKSINDCPQPSGGEPWTKFPKTSAWNNCPFGVLRIDITPNNTATVQSVDAAIANTMTIFVYPSSGNPSSPPMAYYKDHPVAGRINQGLVVPAACSNTECSLQLAQLDFQKAYMRVRSIYRSTQMFEINAQTSDIGSGPAYSFDAQIEIDVTGKAQDVLRRMRVRVSKTGGSSRTDVNGFSDYALQAGDSICKRFVASPILGQDQSSCPE